MNFGSDVRDFFDDHSNWSNGFTRDYAEQLFEAMTNHAAILEEKIAKFREAYPEWADAPREWIMEALNGTI